MLKKDGSVIHSHDELWIVLDKANRWNAGFKFNTTLGPGEKMYEFQIRART